MKRELAIIGASYLQLPLILKAKEMGYRTHVFAWAADDVGEKAADYFYPVSIIEKDKILEKCREIGICGIVSIASDLAVITVNYVAEALGLPCNSPESTLISTNKYYMRKAFEKNGDPSPKCILVDSSTDIASLEISFPAIVKPTDRSGSRAICKVGSEAELKPAIAAAIQASFENKALIEDYVDGKEFSVEYLSFHGVHTFLAVTEKFTTGAPHFIETGHRQPARLSQDMLQKVQEVVEHALGTLKIENGATHSEIKIGHNGDVKIIEIGARMGGDCIGSDLVRYSTGYDYVKMVIQVACGEQPDFSRVCSPLAVECVYILEQKDLEKYNRLKEDRPEDILQEVEMHPERIGQVRDSSNRAGCYLKKV